MKIIYEKNPKKLLGYLMAFAMVLFGINTNAQSCVLSNGSVYVDVSSGTMNATVNGMSLYTYSWTNGGSANQTAYYAGWCVTITDTISGCDTTICENCVPIPCTSPCPMIYMPVCGCDGVMYSNSCLAQCAGVGYTPAVSSGMPGGFLPCTSPPLPSWDCVNGSCVDPGTGNGAYSSLAACQSSCVAVVNHELEFNSSTLDYVEIGNASSVIANKTAFSISGWVNPQSNTNHGGFMGFRNNTDADFYLLQLQNTNNIEARFRNSSGLNYDIVAINALDFNQWQHLAFTYDGSYIRLYKNGILIGITAANGTITQTSQSLKLGTLT